ncbi:DUF3549 family protein [Thalassotalea euphylliae]|uniref:DUF3549 family protein n=1 Tax=Thalassotalea euphylliae TaxID=1655234 RepID=A0A3E0U753_9GAMM|nr:DUF3549 family protein [Thalassotalea euphylliae]REL32383.1 DUF3549 family protein [Thalassotalea euphylliae]
MDRIDTISELLQFSGSQFRIYDIGRKITKISKDDFNRVEQNMMPYPYPSQGHAHIAIAFWQAKSKTPYLWFIKLPLDERGLLNQGARNHFIAIIIEALGQDLTVDPTEKQEELLNSNPYHITPAEYKLATINTLVRKELKQPASIHFEHFQEYVSGQLAWDEWQTIGIQGISDLAAEINQASISEAVAKNLHNFDANVLIPFCHALENQQLPLNVLEALVALIKQINAKTLASTESASTESEVTAQMIRALASSAEHPHAIALIGELLAKPQADDIYITIAGRCWLGLNATTLEQLLSQLADKSDLALFTAIFKDLVAIPALRPHVFAVMRSETRSDALAKAIGQLFG